MTKLVLGNGQSLDRDEKPAEAPGPLPSTENHQKELQELKKRKGVWALVPTLITDRNLATKDCIMCIGKAAWTRHASRIRDLVMPEQVAEYNISCARDKAWCDELLETLFTALEDERHLQHLWPEFLGHVDTLKWHMDLLQHVCNNRSMSLAVHHCLPPYLYCHMLAPDDRVAMEASQMALEHWKSLLRAEDAALSGVLVKPLQTMFFRLNPLVRSFYLAVEQDHAKGRVNTVHSASSKLMKVFTQHIGDSRCIESVHQHGRDLCRASRSDTMSTTAIMANVLRSQVLEQRRVECVGFDQAQKAMSSWSSSRKEGVIKSMMTRGKAMPKQIQDLMLPKTKASGLNWPSPSPGSLFQAVASSQWLFHFFGAAPNGQDVNSSWLSFLAKPGTIVAQRSTSLLVLVLASAEHAFLGARLMVHVCNDGSNAYRCQFSRDSIQFHFVVDLDDWVHVKAEPFLAGARGPVMWRRVCDEQQLPLPCLNLLGAALVDGHNITYQQMKELASSAFGVSIKGNPPLKEVQEQLLNLALHGKELEMAKKRLEERCPPDDDIDSCLSEVISDLDQDDANHNDLKELKAKKRQRRLKEAFCPKR